MKLSNALKNREALEQALDFLAAPEGYFENPSLLTHLPELKEALEIGNYMKGIRHLQDIDGQNVFLEMKSSASHLLSFIRDPHPELLKVHDMLSNLEAAHEAARN